jgi:hypothetical protein
MVHDAGGSKSTGFLYKRLWHNIEGIMWPCLFVCLFFVGWASAASHGCTTACWLIVPPALDVLTYGTYGRRIRTGKFCLNADFHSTFRDLLHATNLRHGTHGFTSLPKEGVLRIFPPLKIRRLRPGLNPQTWVPEASTLTPRPPKPP